MFKRLFRGLTAIFVLLLMILIVATNFMCDYRGMINGMLNITTSKIVNDDSAENEDTDYYSIAFDLYGEDTYSKSNANKLERDVFDENIVQSEEGTVLLKNDNSALPLASGTQITLFGNGSGKNSYLSKSISESYLTSRETMTFDVAMADVFGEDNVNDTLVTNVYNKMSATTNTTVNEASISSVTRFESTWENSNGAAVVVLTRKGAEDSDCAMTFTDEDGERHYLGLSYNEEELFKYLKQEKQEGDFKYIVVVINSDWMMELDWLDDYDVDACLLAGCPGVAGYKGVANLIAGNAVPSGHTTDTYASNSLSAPATVNASANTSTYANASAVSAYCGNNSTDYVIYGEGIYVGYKYYETRYEDTVLNSGNAASAVGSSTGSAWNYSDEVDYTFGYGLSYTTFSEKLESVKYVSSTDTFEVQVTVTNTGDYTGKHVVQVYAQTPYGDDAKTRGVEKSAIQIAGYEKTDDLAPDESVTVTVSVERYMLASYDSNVSKGYILSEGDYYLAIGDNAHDALNNVLAAKGYTSADGMVDSDGNAADGNADKAYVCMTIKDTDESAYRYSRVDSSVEVTNQFDNDQLSTYGVDYTYLSRSDWENTFPVATSITATQSMMEDLKGYEYETPDDAPDVDSFTQDAEVQFNIAALKDADWSDTDVWEMFIDQLSVDEMCTLIEDDSSEAASIEDIALLSQHRVDDGLGFCNGKLNATGNYTVGWVSNAVTARTWSTERYSERGKLLGCEAVFSGVNEIWYGGGNMHRTPFNGRNMQYYSEDGNFGYTVAAAEAASMQEVGVNYCIKHFALNDQETSRQGVSTFCNEQALREEYLRVFEGAICEGGALGIMCGFNRIGCTYNVMHKTSLNNVVKSEWNFKGHITTDAGGQGGDLVMLAAGIDYTCWDSDTTEIKNAIADGDGYILQRLRESAKHNLYAASRTYVINGVSSNTKVVTITPWWETAMFTTTIIVAALAVASIAGTVTFTVIGRKKGEARQ